MQNDYDIKSVMEEIEQDLIVRMKRALWNHKEDEKTENFDWPQWQAIKLKQFDEYKKANKEIFNSKTKPINRYLYKYIKSQFKEGASKTNKEALNAGIIKKEDSQLGGAFFGLNHRKLDALIKSTKEDMSDVKYATLRMANDQYRQIIFKAQVYANTGAGTVKQAIDMATKDFLSKGFNCIEYKDRRRVNIADYCDMAIRTANKRANLMGQGEMRKKLGNSLVYVSKHGGACDKCTPWEGRVYIDDVWSGGKAEDGPYPLLSEAIKGGLFHPRCQHGISTYYEGINDEPEEVTEAKHNHDEHDTYTQYLQKKQNQYERLASGSLLPENTEKYQNKANELQKQIESSKIEINDLPVQFSNKKEINNSNVVLEYINNKKDANKNVIQLYKNMGKKCKLPFKIAHAKDHSVKISYNSTNKNITEIVLTIPKVDPNNVGQIETWLHENMHLIDFMLNNENMNKYNGMLSTNQIKLKSILQTTKNKAIGKDIQILFNQYNVEYEKLKEKITIQYNEKIRKLTEKFNTSTKGIVWTKHSKVYKNYQKEYNYLKKEYLEVLDTNQRNLLGGGVPALQDIYDALSGGEYRDKGIVKYGHGSKTYSNINSRIKEVVANYSSLSIVRPDLIEILRKDKPELVNELDNLIQKMLQ